MNRISLLFVLAALPTACTAPPISPSPTPTVLLSAYAPTPDQVPSAVDKPTSSPSPTVNAPSPTLAPTGTATSAATRTATSSPTAAETSFPTPIPPPNAAQTCDNIAAQGRYGLYVLYVQPLQKLAWDMAPRQFSVGLCNSLSVPLVPESHFVVSIHLPFRKDGGGQTSELSAQLSPGFHEITLGTWTPGLESHKTVCVQKAAVEVIVGYSDQERSSNFRPLEYPDGKDRLLLPVECGGDYA